MRTMSLTALWLFAHSVFAALPQPVSIQNGLLEGETLADNLTVYRGVPYAAPPAGDNRWREPQPVVNWSGTRTASEFAPRCMQNASSTINVSEDCLYLNIWTSADAPGQNLPVFVWLHGGAFTSGAGSEAAYDGSSLASKGAVVVTLNYRLGNFGFFAHPELTAESANNSSGNYAMLDVIQALVWVYDNIEAFGGDPVNVTLAGESVGARMVANMLASPLAGGLIHRAIMQSSSWMGLGINRQMTLTEMEALGMEKARDFGATSLTELRQASAEEILSGMPPPGTNEAINVDGYFLPRDAALIWDAGEQQPIDVLTGSNRDEASLFNDGPQTLADYQAYAENRFGNLASRFLALYPASSDADAVASYQQAFNDEMAWTMRYMALVQGRRGLGAYVYYFTRVPPGQEARGAAHLAELPYMFNQNGQHPEWTETDRTLADAMSAYWLRFAASTNPNTNNLARWPAYRSEEAGNVMVLGNEIMAESELTPSAETLQFFADFFQQHLATL